MEGKDYTLATWRKRVAQLNKKPHQIGSFVSMVGDMDKEMSAFNNSTDMGAGITESDSSVYDTATFEEIDKAVQDGIDKVIENNSNIDFIDAEYNGDTSKVTLFIKMNNGVEKSGSIRIDDISGLSELSSAVERKGNYLVDSMSLKEARDADDWDDNFYMDKSDYIDEGDWFYSDGRDYYITEIIDTKWVDGYELAVVEVNHFVDSSEQKDLVGNKQYYYFVLLNGDVEWGPCDTYKEAKEWYDGVNDGYYEEDDIYQSYHDSSEDELRKMGAFDNLNDPLDEDTVKRNGKWANVGKDGKADSGKFNTKKEADAQRKAMFANGYKG